jgi:hypothetical protein
MQPNILSFALAGVGFDKLSDFTAIKYDSISSCGSCRPIVKSLQTMLAVVIVLLQLKRWYWVSGNHRHFQQ